MFWNFCRVHFYKKKLSNEILVAKIQPVVLEKIEFQYQGYQCQGHFSSYLAHDRPM